MGESILYVEPIYLQAQGIALPELKRVILASTKKVVMQPTLDGALAALLGAPLPTEPQPPGGEPTVPSQAAEQLDRIQQVLQDLREGLTSLEEAVSQLAELIEEEQE